MDHDTLVRLSPSRGSRARLGHPAPLLWVLGVTRQRLALWFCPPVLPPKCRQQLGLGFRLCLRPQKSHSSLTKTSKAISELFSSFSLHQGFGLRLSCG